MSATVIASTKGIAVMYPIINYHKSKTISLSSLFFFFLYSFFLYFVLFLKTIVESFWSASFGIKARFVFEAMDDNELMQLHEGVVQLTKRS